MLSPAHPELLLAHGLPWIAYRLAFILVVITAFALIALWMRAVTKGGALAGWFCAFALIVGDGFPLFFCLVTTFVLVALATGHRAMLKAERGLAESRHGRDAAQVLSNVGVAAACAVMDGFWGPERIWGVAAVAALAEAAADTVSSEIGQATAARPRLITSFQQVPAGTDGAVSWSGSLTGAAAGSLVSLVGYASGLISLEAAGVAAAAGVAGMLFDSLLGATLQRRGRLGNNLVNLLSTGFAALLAMAVAMASAIALM